MGVNAPVLGAAVLFLCLGIGLLLWQGRSNDGTQKQTLVTSSWLCLSLAATLTLFAFFPQSDVKGSAFGFSLTGAAAFVVVVLLAILRVYSKVAEIDRENTSASGRTSLASGPHAVQQTVVEPLQVPETLTSVEVFTYAVSNARGKKICVVTGNLRRITFVDIWVNSENTDMRMSSYYEKSVSGMIRYEGAKRDQFGNIVDDLIADELRKIVGDRAPVSPGTAIATSSGELSRSNNVSHVIHVASVQGVLGEGYRQLASVDRCVTNALSIADGLAHEKKRRSIVFPLLGVGSGRGDRSDTALLMVTAAVDYLRQHPESSITDVCFLARTNLTRDAFLGAMERVDGLSPTAVHRRL